jgi:hypothetical protein
VENTGTVKKEYEGKLNRHIEEAFKAEERNVKFSDNDGNVFVIDFDSMKEYPQSDPTDTVNVIRNITMKGK